MILLATPIVVSNGQIQIFDTAVDHREWPLWSETDSALGFTCSREAAFFSVPDHDGICLLQIVEDDEETPAAPFWTIKAPFETSTGKISAGSIGDYYDFYVEPGRYTIFFSAALPANAAIAEHPDCAFVLHVRLCLTGGEA